MYKQAEEEKAARKKNRRKPLPPKSVFWRYVLLAAGLFVLLLIFAAVGVALTLWRLFNATFKRKLLFELKSQKILFVTGTNYCIAEPIWHLRHCVIGLVDAHGESFQDTTRLSAGKFSFLHAQSK